MHRKIVPAAALGLALAVVPAVQQAQAKDHTGRNVLLGIAAAIGAAAVVASATSAARGPRRHYNYGRVGFRERAVGVCMRAADRSNARRGGGGVEFLRVNSMKKRSYGLKMYLTLRSYEPWGRRRRVVKCKVRRNLRLKTFAWVR